MVKFLRGRSGVKGGTSRSPKVYEITAVWDDEAEVWVATSEDVPGLVTEADTVEQLTKKLKVMVPELLELNGMDGDDHGPRSVPLHVVTHTHDVVTVG